MGVCGGKRTHAPVDDYVDIFHVNHTSAKLSQSPAEF